MFMFYVLFLATSTVLGANPSVYPTLPEFYQSVRSTLKGYTCYHFVETQCNCGKDNYVPITFPYATVCIYRPLTIADSKYTPFFSDLQKKVMAPATKQLMEFFILFHMKEAWNTFPSRKERFLVWNTIHPLIQNIAAALRPKLLQTEINVNYNIGQQACKMTIYASLRTVDTYFGVTCSVHVQFLLRAQSKTTNNTVCVDFSKIYNLDGFPTKIPIYHYNNLDILLRSDGNSLPPYTAIKNDTDIAKLLIQKSGPCCDYTKIDDWVKDQPYGTTLSPIYPFYHVQDIYILRAGRFCSHDVLM